MTSPGPSVEAPICTAASSPPTGGMLAERPLRCVQPPSASAAASATCRSRLEERSIRADGTSSGGIPPRQRRGGPVLARSIRDAELQERLVLRVVGRGAAEAGRPRRGARAVHVAHPEREPLAERALDRRVDAQKARVGAGDRLEREPVVPDAAAEREPL